MRFKSTVLGPISLKLGMAPTVLGPFQIEIYTIFIRFNQNASPVYESKLFT